MPTPYSPCRRQGETELAHSRAKNLCGIWISTPAPSPVSGIATAGAAMGQVDQDLDALDYDFVRFCPLMLATKPIPQASCSWRGSYRPCAGG